MPRAHPPHRAVPGIFEADRSLAVEQYAMGKGADLDLEVGPLHRRAQIGDRGAAASHPADGQLVVADALLLGAVEIGVGLEPGLLRAGRKGVVQFVVRAQIRDVERAALPMIIVGAALLVLGAAEIRQHVVIRPADIAELAPMVEILALAADVDQPVDRARAAEHLAARPRDAPPVEPRHRLGLELPGDPRMIDVAVEPGRDMDPRVGVLAAGLDHQHLRRRVGRQPVGQHAPGRAGADDDEIVFRVELHCLPHARCSGASVSSCKAASVIPGTMSITTKPSGVTSMTASSV